MTKPCGVKVYIAIYDQALWCDGVYCYLRPSCVVCQVYIAIYDQAVWCDGVYCYL